MRDPFEIEVKEMNFQRAVNSPYFVDHRLAFMLMSFAVVALMTVAVSAQTQGFTEPFRTIDLSSDESGAISTLNVEEGQRVDKDEIIGTLDSKVQLLQLEIAKHMAESKSQLVAAKQTLEKRQEISERLRSLVAKGHASQSEIIRADMELSIAQAKYLAAREESEVREIEMRRAEVQLERRNIRAPFDSIVSKIHRREGEFLSPLRPEIVTLIQSDALLATFAVPSNEIQKFEIGKEFSIQMIDSRTVVGTVHSIGVQIDAQSGTVVVKLLINNEQQDFRAGESCTLNG